MAALTQGFMPDKLQSHEKKIQFFWWRDITIYTQIGSYYVNNFDTVADKIASLQQNKFIGNSVI